MCIQEQAATRPLIRDVVTALSYLANQNYDRSAATTHRGSSPSGGKANGEEVGESGRRWDFEVSEKEESPKETVRKTSNRDMDRERAVAEAKMWGENLREKRRQNGQGSFDHPSNGRVT